MEVKEQIIVLSEICRHDLDLVAGKNKIIRLSKDSGSASKNASELETHVHELSAKKEQNLKNYRALEQKLQEEKTNLRKWEQRADKIKGEREYIALNSEITSQKRTITGIESELADLVIKLKEFDKTIVKTEGAQQENVSKAKSAFDEVKELLAQENENVAKIENAKNILLEKLPIPLRLRYKRIYDRMGGTAVAVLDKASCQACRRTVPPELFIRVYKHEIIEQCPSCQRFLVPLNLGNEVTPE